MNKTFQNCESLHKKSWGRASAASLPTLICCLLMMVFVPLLVFYFYIAAFRFDCSLTAPFYFIFQKGFTLNNLFSLFPKWGQPGLLIYCSWVLFQIVLSLIPDLLHKITSLYKGGVLLGAVTPAGNRLSYNINGLQAWMISNSLFVLFSFGLGLFSPTIIFDYFGEILWVTTFLGWSLGIFSYIKALYFPSFPTDRKFSGSSLYDFCMGVELNPRIGLIDLKLFFNGRPGIVAWTLINLSFASAQYAKYGFVSNSMLLVNFFHALYVLYFFWKEAWYLKTIDIHHDHFGWMLAFGDCVFLPYMYTLQALYLVFHPVELSPEFALFVLSFGLLGFYIFCSANNQKDSFRESKGKDLIWGKKPKSMPCSYLTEDGVKRESTLLLSGFWGISRHMNYTGDLILSLAYSLACGTASFFPYFYFIFLFILLVNRCLRDEKRCFEKYGETWKEYCKVVPYRLIPYVW